MLLYWHARRNNVSAYSPRLMCPAFCSLGGAGPCRICSEAKFYTEIVVDRLSFRRLLPHSIEAIFYIADDSCYDHGTQWCLGGESSPAWCTMGKDPVHKAGACQAFAHAAHRAFTEHFAASGWNVPLLRLDPFNLTTPLSAPEGDRSG